MAQGSTTRARKHETHVHSKSKSESEIRSAAQTEVSGEPLWLRTFPFRGFDWDTAIRTYDRHVFVGLLAAGLGPKQARELIPRVWMQLCQQYAEGNITEIQLPDRAIEEAQRVAEAVLANPRPTPRRMSPDAFNRAQVVLLSCPPSSQRVFRMVYENPGLLHREVARETGLSVARVRQILCEVRKAIRRTIEEDV